MAVTAELAIDTVEVASSGLLNVILELCDEVASKMSEVCVAMPLN